MNDSILTGAALKTEAARLSIPGRSRMRADELRSAVAAAQAALNAPATALATLDDAVTTTALEPYMPEEDDPTGDIDEWSAEMAGRMLSDRPGSVIPDQQPPATPAASLATPPTPAFFAARWGKRKPSLNNRTHRKNRR